ncbi:TPA: endonuclease [bacterium]|nr:endonuclease [bacterium]
MPKIGVHLSSLDLNEIVNKATYLGCETIQIFTRNPKSWAGPPNHSKNDIKKFKKSLKERNISPSAIHASYLPNLASPDSYLLEKSINNIISELKCGDILGAEFVVIHPGSHKGQGSEIGVRNIIGSINVIFSFIKNPVLLLLETTAAEGNEIGTIDEIAKIIRGCDEKERLGICFDTCHIFAAGCDIVNNLDGVLEEFDKKIGLSKIKLIHLNDSKYECGSKRDRHLHIGDGFIGEEGFERILNCPFFSDIPAILETPKKDDWDDVKNIGMVRKLLKN